MLRYALLPVFLLLQNCFLSDDKRAGGEDFPNSIGPLVTSAMSDSKGWNKLDSAPTSIGNPSSNPGIPTESAAQRAPQLALDFPSPSLEADTLQLDSSRRDTIGLKVYLYNWKSELGTAVIETLVFAYDDKYKDTIPENDNIHYFAISNYNTWTQSLRSWTRFGDGDGDSLLTPVPGAVNRALVLFLSPSLNIMNISTLWIDAGPDDDFGTDGDSASLNNLTLYTSLTQLKISTLDSVFFAQWTDADGDSIIEPQTGNKVNSVRMIANTYLLGGKKVEELIIEAGPDRDFERERDNQILAYSNFLLSPKGDTLSTGIVLDRDNDGILWDSTMDSSKVEIQVMENFFPRSALIPVKTYQVRMVIFPRDSTKNYLIKFNERKDWASGYEETASVTGPAPDSTFAPRDTFVAQWRSATPSVTNSAFRQFQARGNLGVNLSDDSDDEMTGLAVRSYAPNLKEFYLQLDFKATKPVLTGAAPTDGELAGMVVMAPADTFRLDGTLTDGKFKGTIILPSGKKVDAQWSKNGQ